MIWSVEFLTSADQIGLIMSMMFDNPAAFAPFYDDRVSFSLKRAGRTAEFSVRACVLDRDGDALSVMGDAAAPAAEHSWTILVPIGDWPDVSSPQAEDEVRIVESAAGIPLDRVFRVSDVVRHGDSWQLTLRTRGDGRW